EVLPTARDHPDLVEGDPERSSPRMATRARSKSPNERNGISSRIFPDQAALIPANLTTLPHFSVSSAMRMPKSADESASPVPPMSASRALILGSASAALISVLSVAIISVGVSLGAPRPNHALAS